MAGGNSSKINAQRFNKAPLWHYYVAVLEPLYPLRIPRLTDENLFYLHRINPGFDL